MSETNKKIWFGVILFVVIVLAGGLIYVVSLRTAKQSQPQEKVVATEKQPTALGDVIPQNAKNPEEFMAKVQEKADEIEKKYDSSLTEFAEKKWIKIFEEYNNITPDYFSKNIKILSDEIEKTNDQSTLFRVKYRIEKEDNSLVNSEDFFYLIISKSKKNELGLNDVKDNVFLTEEDIKNSLGKEGFAKITKIQK